VTDCVQPFTNDFLRADIHEMLSPDILHQLIKGGFKDHLVDWVERYLNRIHGKAKAEKILDEIDHRYVYHFIIDTIIHTPPELQPLPHSLACNVFPKASILNSGLAIVVLMSFCRRTTVSEFCSGETYQVGSL